MSRRRGRRRTACAVVGVALLTGAPAMSQEIRGGNLVCGGMPVPLRRVSASLTDAISARREVEAELIGLIDAVMRRAATDGCNPPGLSELTTTLAQRHALVADPTASGRLDLELRRQAMRVEAHRLCHAAPNASVERFDLCWSLLSAENIPAPVPGPGPAPRVQSIEELIASSGLGPIDTVTAEDDQSVHDERVRLFGPNSDQLRDQLRGTATTSARRLAAGFNAACAPAAGPRPPPDLDRVWRVVARFPEPSTTPVGCSGVAFVSLQTAFCSETLETLRATCESADLFVDALGSVHYRPLHAASGGATRNSPGNACINLSDFSPLRGAHVEVGSNVPGQRTAMLTLHRDVWPGRVTSLPQIDHLDSNASLEVARLTVWAAPSGFALQTLARRYNIFQRRDPARAPTQAPATPSAVAPAVTGPTVTTTTVTTATMPASAAATAPAEAAGGTTTAAPAGASAVATTYADINELAAGAETLAEDERAILDVVDYSRAMRAIAGYLEQSPSFSLILPPAIVAAGQHTGEDQRRHALEALDAARRVLAKEALDWHLVDHGAGARRAHAEALRLFPGEPITDWDGLAATLSAYTRTLAESRPEGTDLTRLTDLNSRRRSLQQTLGGLCDLATELYPAVVHDLLLTDERSANRPDVIDYDYDRGLLGSNARRGRFHESRAILLRVFNVPADRQIDVKVDNDQVIVSQTAVLGIRGPAADSGSQRETSSLATDLPQDSPPQFRGTRIISLGRLSGGRRYKLEVLEHPIGSSTPRPIARHRLDIDGEFPFGLLAGFGAAMYPGDPVPVRDGPLTDTWTVQRRPYDFAVALPLILNWYPGGRTAPSPGWTFGIGMGLDLLLPMRRFILPALSVGYGSVALTVAATIEVPDKSEGPARVDDGVRVTGASVTPASLVSTFGPENSVRFGAFVGLTVDLDLFRLAFQSALGSVRGLPDPGQAGGAQ